MGCSRLFWTTSSVRSTTRPTRISHQRSKSSHRPKRESKTTTREARRYTRRRTRRHDVLALWGIHKCSDSVLMIERSLGRSVDALDKIELGVFVGELHHVCCHFWLWELALGGPAVECFARWVGMERCVVKAWTIEQALEVDTFRGEGSEVFGVKLSFALENGKTG